MKRLLQNMDGKDQNCAIIKKIIPKAVATYVQKMYFEKHVNQKKVSLSILFNNMINKFQF